MSADIPLANQAWFHFAVLAGKPAGTPLAVYSFSGKESVSAPFEFDIELVSSDSNLATVYFLGKPVCLTITEKSGGTRHIHGIIRQMEQLHTGNRFTHYRCKIVPRLWFLSKTRNHKIFQNKTVVEIIEEVLKKNRFPQNAYAFKMREKYRKREFTVQYSESDMHFTFRLCEEEGIYFYFEHSQTGHCLCFSDAEGGPPIPDENSVRFYPGSGNVAESTVIDRANILQRINSDSATYRDWNFLTPETNLEQNQREPDWEKAPAAQALPMEIYTFPHLYQTAEEGERYAKIQLLRQLTWREWLEGESDLARLTPGYTFTLHSHPRLDANRAWWVVSVHHEGEQPAVLEKEAPDRGMVYRSKFTAIPGNIRFVPEIQHKKVRIDGLQSAIVVGPKGEEIYCDAHARVWVQFPWDRLGRYDENSSCPVRVSQGWAGSAYGTMAIPRIGQEILIAYEEGNTDRPIVVGRVNNAHNMPPYELPMNKTRTVFKSMSTPGKDGEQRGFNELRIEDRLGEEEVYLHAEKDVNVHVKNDWKEHVLHDRHETTENFTYLETKGETHETLRSQRKTELFANDNRTVHGDDHLAVDGKWLAKSGDEIHIKAGAKVVIEAGAELTVKAGGQWIRLDPSGIRMSAMLNLGQGPPGVGTGAGPLVPSLATVPLVPTPPTKQCLQLACNLGTPMLQ